MRKLCLIFIACGSIGCGSENSVPTPKLVELLTVKDSQGTEKQIPSAELYESTQHELPVTQVLVVDRQTNKQVFVALDQIPSATQATARYVPVTSSQTAPVSKSE
jgi:hypothetical protein